MWAPQWDHVLRLLDRVRRSRRGWIARCPAHDDVRPSLSVLDRGNSLGVKCFGPGCRFQEIRAALSARAGRQVFLSPYNEPPAQQRNGKRIREWSMPIIATYPYTDESGEVLFEVCRVEPGDNGGRKTFFQRRPNAEYRPGLSKPEAEWAYNLDGCRRVLYRLPELMEAASVWKDQPIEKRRWILVVEGEGCAEAARGIGVLATTNVCGAKSFHRAEYEVLRGARVCVVPDVDAPDPKTFSNPGMEHALQVVGALQGIASAIKVLILPGLSPGQDLTDWIQAVSQYMTPADVKRRLYEIVGEAPEWGPYGPVTSVQGTGTAFLEASRAVAEAIRMEEPRLWHAAELAGLLDVAVLAFCSELAECPDPVMLYRRLTQLAGQALRGALDLRLEKPGSLSTVDYSPARNSPR